MGSFANLGALAGAASGWNEGSKAAEAKKQNSMDQLREERLETLKNDRLVAREATQYAQEDKRDASLHGNAMELAGAKNEFTTSERENKQEFEAGEGVLDRESAEGIANDKATATKAKDRRKWTRGRTQGTETMEDGVLTTTEGQPYAVHPYSQITYLQENDMWIAEGSERAPRPPAQRKAAEKALYDKPTPYNMELYERKYGYLPKESIGAAERYLESNPE